MLKQLFCRWTWISLNVLSTFVADLCILSRQIRTFHILLTPSDHVFLSWPTPLNTIRPCLSQLTHSLIHWQFACDLIFKWISWLQCLDTVLSIWPATNLLQRSVRDLAYFMVSLPETWPKSRWVSQRETWPISWWVSQRPDLNHSESPRDLA